MSKRTILIFASVLMIVTYSRAAVRTVQSGKVDVSGMWTFTVQSDAGTSNPMVTFRQDGEKLTGHYSSMLVGEADLTGSVKGQAIEFTVHAEVQGFKLEMKFDGTIDSKDLLKGKMSTDLGAGTFTAKRN